MGLEKDLDIEIFLCLSQAISLAIGFAKIFTSPFPSPEPQFIPTPIVFGIIAYLGTASGLIIYLGEVADILVGKESAKKIQRFREAH